MTTYTHFGKQADVFKHLVLCEVLQNEKPQVYVETNSASAIYQMERTPEKEYGIYHFLEKANEEKTLKESTYYKLESAAMQERYYLGSPALAMKLLKKQAQSFLFFDIEKDALENVELYAKQMKLSAHIRIYNTDSLEEVIKLLPALPESSFLHIDPYEIDKKGLSGMTYLDLLINATKAGMKCLLWYGFMTEDDKARINQYIVDTLKKEGIESYTCIELIMNSIKKDTITCNPGIVGSGILTTNLSQKSNSLILDYSKQLVHIYEGSRFKDSDGGLYKDIVESKG